MEQSAEEQEFIKKVDERVKAHIDAYHRVNEEALNAIMKIVEHDRGRINKLSNELELANRRISNLASNTGHRNYD